MNSFSDNSLQYFVFELIDERYKNNQLHELLLVKHNQRVLSFIGITIEDE